MNHPHEPQAAAMDRAGELPDGEQLRSGNLCEKCKCADWCAEHGCWALTECINSGQVSAAQVVAHADAGELPPLPAPFEIEWPSLHPHGLGCGVEDRDITDRYEAAEYGWQDGVDKVAGCVPDEIYTADQMRAYATVALAAKQEEVVRLREAAEAVLSNEEHAFSGGMRNYQKGSQTWQVYEDLRIALTAPGEKHE